METWKNIKECNNRYSISNLGRVKKNHEIIIRSNGRRQIIYEKILTPITNNIGYVKCRVNVRQGVVYNLYIHRFVAKYFLGDRPTEKHQINHIDGNKKNNSYENLEYVSAKENIRHAWRNGLSTNNHCKKRVNIDGVIYDSFISASKALNINRNTIRNRVKSQPNYSLCRD